MADHFGNTNNECVLKIPDLGSIPNVDFCDFLAGAFRREFLFLVLAEWTSGTASSGLRPAPYAFVISVPVLVQFFRAPCACAVGPASAVHAFICIAIRKCCNG